MNNRIKYTVNNATISDKIYFRADDITGVDFQTFKYVLFTYNMGSDFHSTIEYNENSGVCSVPSGSWGKLDIKNLKDERFVSEKYSWTFDGTLRQAQQEIVDKILVGDKLYSGLIQAPCGFGKSFVGGYLISNYGKSTIIICHTKLLAYQWYDLLKEKIIGAEIGFIGDGKESIKPITVAIYKSLVTRMDKIKGKFEVSLTDEAHLAPAETFSKVINGIDAKVKLALTATPIRKDGLHVVFNDYFGPNRIVARDEGKLQPSVQIVKTSIPFTVLNPQRDWTKQLTKLGSNDQYLNLIATTARDKISHKRCLLILSERIDMLEKLNLLIPRSVLLVGSTPAKQREDILENAGIKYDAILTTKIFDEGISCHRLDTIMLTCPNNNYAKLEQRIGRILRAHPDKQEPLIVDFWLAGHIVNSQQKSRQEWYQKNNYPILKN